MKVYLGDGVYATKEFDQITLTTENGYAVTNTIYLEREVMQALILFAAAGFVLEKEPPAPLKGTRDSLSPARKS